jgi:hypothetical protein
MEQELVSVNKRLDSLEVVLARVEDKLDKVLSLDSFMNEGTRGMIMGGSVKELEEEDVFVEEGNICQWGWY